MTRKKNGFGLIELVVVLGILAIVLAFTLPNFLGWRTRTELRNTAEELRRAAKLAKSRAIQENEIVVVDLDADRDGIWDNYLAFVDTGNGSGGPPDYRHDPEEPTVYKRQLPDHIRIELVDPATGDPAQNYVPQGRVRDTRFLRLAVEQHQHDVQEKGIAGGLFPANFHESKISFKEESTENWWKVLYDGQELDFWIINTKIMPSTLLFFENGECLTPIRIIFVNSEGEKLMIEITAWTITKVTKIG